MERVKHPQKLGDRLADPDGCSASFVALFEGWVEDLERLHSSLAEHLGSSDWELVVVDNPVDDAASERIAQLDRVTHIPLRDGVGWGAGRSLGLRLACGRIVVVVDTSVETTGDLLGRLEQDLTDANIGLVGRWGVVTRNGFDFEEPPEASELRDVDGVEAYLMAMRREILRETGLFDPKFRFYRNADLDFSFRVRASGYRTVIDPALPLVRHKHRLWKATPEHARAKASRKNFFRFRDRWGEREDLFVALQPPDA